MAFIIIQDDVILYERYLLNTSVSVAKSFASALVGIAIADGLISSIEDPILRYLPEHRVIVLRMGEEWGEIDWWPEVPRELIESLNV